MGGTTQSKYIDSNTKENDYSHQQRNGPGSEKAPLKKLPYFARCQIVEKTNGFSCCCYRNEKPHSGHNNKYKKRDQTRANVIYSSQYFLLDCHLVISLIASRISCSMLSISSSCSCSFSRIFCINGSHIFQHSGQNFSG